MLFWNSLAFLMIQQMLAIWSLVPLPFLNPAWISGSSRFMYCWSLASRILSITLLVCEMSAIVHSLALPFFGIGMKTDLFHLLYLEKILANYFSLENFSSTLFHFKFIAVTLLRVFITFKSRLICSYFPASFLMVYVFLSSFPD